MSMLAPVRRKAVCAALVFTALASLVPSAHASSDASALEAGFLAPPDSARPRTWWHWTRSNVTPEGITKDLEWMKRVGLAGFQLADVNVGGGQTVDPKVPFGTPAWYDAVRHAAAEADRLGLEMAIFSSPGWSETGGPWVKPEEAMKKLVWSETRVQGPGLFSGWLPPPPSNIGQIRNTGARYHGEATDEKPYYADTAVIAYRTPEDEPVGELPAPRVSTHEGPVDGAALLDDQLDTRLEIPAPTDGSPAWVQYQFRAPFAAQAVTIGGQGGSARGIPVGRVLASDDGVTFRTLVTMPGPQLYRQGMVRTYAFPPTRARFYRIELTGAPLGPAATMSQAHTSPPSGYVLSEAVLHPAARLHRWEEKAGFSFLFEYDSVRSPEPAASSVVPADSVIDVTANMRPDGAFEWNAPPGRWTVLRIGQSLTGAKNRPATPEGTGFEADKLSRKHMESYVRGWIDPLREALGEHFGKSLRYVTMDSWEAGTNNWTETILDEFRARRGYDPRPYLPALTGRIVGSSEISERFLWDFRRTLADLWADAHYGTMAGALARDGIGIYAEAAGVSLEMPEDTLLNKSKVEIPMGEFWVNDLHPRLMYVQDVRGAASAARAYGKPIVAAESFTGGGFESPATLHRVGAYWLAQGVNRVVFHTSAHQPLDTKPGNLMVGTHLHRHITWAELAKPYLDHLARACFLLQHGRNVADIAYLLDEGAPSTPPIWGAGVRPTPPRGYEHDFLNTDVLLHRIRVADDGRLATPEGTSWRLLVLPNTDRMRPEVARKIRELVASGATVLGPRPTRSPSLAGHPGCDAEVRTLAEDVWGDLDGVSRTVRRHGKGTVFWGLPLEHVMEHLGLEPDLEHDRLLDADLAWTHRADDEVDIYYLASLSDRPVEIDARFRVSGREAEIWRSDSGTIEPASYTIADGRTTVPLRMHARESLFVVFRKPTHVSTRSIPAPVETLLGSVAGPWEVAFAPNLGAPARVRFSQLASWTTHADPGVKHFSGTATYTTTFRAPSVNAKNTPRVFLDLGRVGDLAEVALNGRPLGILWKPPYRVDVTAHLARGNNRLEIKVTNQWTNRILGDREAEGSAKILQSDSPPADAWALGLGRPKDAPAPESGLLGPVTLVGSNR
jgi:hypothetical protein